MVIDTQSGAAHLGVTVAGRSLHAHWMGEGGEPLARLAQPLTEDPRSALAALEALTVRRAQLAAAGAETVRACVCLGTRDRLRFGGSALDFWSEIAEAPPLLLPSLSGAVVGAAPRHPVLLLSLGEELKLAAKDGGLGYREVRWQEGGASWWLAELERLAEHSMGLARQLSRSAQKSRRARLARLPELLALGHFPAPDPVLKVRLDKIVRLLAERLSAVAGRLPGVSRVCFTGYLSRSVFGALIAEELEEPNSGLRLVSAKHPPEVGAALLAWVFQAEEAERELLGKESLAEELVRPRPGRSDGQIPQPLLRRLQRPDRSLPEGLG